jgi:hypothetical protein
MAGKGSERAPTHLDVGIRLADGIAHVTNRAHTPLAEDTIGRFDTRTEQPVDRAEVVVARAVREREVRLLEVPGALHEQRKVGGVARNPGFDHVMCERPHHVPDLAPYVVEALAERERMLVAENGPVRVVVEHAELGAHGQKHRVLRREHEADNRDEAARPTAERPERRAAPVVRVDQPAHVARNACHAE